MNSGKSGSLAGILARYNAIPVRRIGTVILALYSILLVVMMIWHEPSIDEAQSWLIARDASYGDILFYLPRYESHPPFWHLLLSVPAKLGVSFELGLKSIQFASAFLMMALFIFLSPFDNLVKTGVPFTYFLFYQYGVVSRPYALLLAGIFLCAYTFRQRKTNPMRLIASLAFLAMWSAYGIAIAGGIALCWLIESFRDSIRAKSNPFADLLKERGKVIGLVSLLIFACALICEIMPAADNYVANATSEGLTSYITDIAKWLFVIPSETFFTNLAKGGTGQDLTTAGIAVCIVISVVVLVTAGYYCKRAGTLIYLVIPYLFYTVMAARYVFVHHFGVGGACIVFAIWTAVDSIIQEGADKAEGRASKVFGITGAVLVTAMTFIGIYWSFTACVNDTMYHESSGRVLAAAVRDMGIDKDGADMQAAWYIQKDDSGKVVKIYYGEGANTFTSAAPYFSCNIISNLYPDKTYCVTKTATEAENADILESVKSRPAPEFIIAHGGSGLNDYLEYTGNKESYIPVAVASSGTCYKDSEVTLIGTYIFARTDYAGQHGLTPLA